jgi:hypothetical protein
MDLRLMWRKDSTSKGKRKGKGVGGPVNGGIYISEKRLSKDAIISWERSGDEGGGIGESGSEGDRGRGRCREEVERVPSARRIHRAWSRGDKGM